MYFLNLCKFRQVMLDCIKRAVTFSVFSLFLISSFVLMVIGFVLPPGNTHQHHFRSLAIGGR